MGIVGWLKEFISGKPSAERSDRWRVEDEIASIRRMSAKTSTGPAAFEVGPSPATLTFLDPQPAPPTDSDDKLFNEDFHSGAASGDYGTILRRAAQGSALTFDYPSREGEIKERHLTDWVEFPQYVQGVCQDTGKVLTFRKDRVLDWFDGSERALRAPKGKSRL